HLVEGIQPPRDGEGWRVAFRDLETGDDGVIEAPIVVLAAGTLGSPRLLLRTRRRLPALSPAPGTRFSGNGDAAAIACDPPAGGGGRGRAAAADSAVPAPGHPLGPRGQRGTGR